ncbi:MAG: lipoyl(octanoyl) transferase, partial [Lysobacterales bacterium]
MKILDFGLIDYKEAYLKQLECVQKVIDGAEPMLIFCEHMPVLTLGRLAKREYILASDDELKDKGVSIHNIDRGGEVTLHAPGQLVVYPIIDLKKHSKDLHVYLHNLEEVVIALLTEFD